MDSAMSGGTQSATLEDEAQHEGDEKYTARTGARPKKPTQRGLLFWRENKEEAILSVFNQLQVKCSAVNNLMHQAASPEALKEQYAEWLNIYSHLYRVYDEYSDMFSEADVHIKKTFDREFGVVKSFKTSVEGWFRDDAQTSSVPRHSSVQPEDSVSQTGQQSISKVASSLSSAKLEEKQKRAELLARASTLKRKQELELQRLKLQLEQEELNLSIEMAVNEAKSKALDEFDQQELRKELNFDSPSPVKSSVSAKAKPASVIDAQGLSGETEVRYALNPDALPYIPDIPRKMAYAKGPDISKARQNSMSIFDTPVTSTQHARQMQNAPTSVSQDLVLSMVRQIKKPTAEISKFNGDPLQYRRFIRQFTTKVVIHSEDDSERMSYLEQFTTGEANRVVSGFSYLPAETGYKAALQELEERYCDQEVIANAYINKAINWPHIKPDNPKALDDFCIFLTECQHAVRSIEAVRMLEYSSNLKQLVAKLPIYYHDRWRNIVDQTKARKEVVHFDQLVHFIKQEARKANDPTYGREAMKGEIKPTGKPLNAKSNRPKGTFHTKVTDENQDKQDKTFACLESGNCQPHGTKNAERPQLSGNAFSKPCLYCRHDSHCLENCQKIKALSYQDRINFLKTKGLCYGCLIKGHQSKDCRRKATCGVCQRKHPTICHVEDKDPKPETAASPEVKGPSAFVTLPESLGTYMGTGDHSCRMAIIPVKAKMKNGSKAVDTYAFLDPGSSVSFCTEDLMEQIGGSGRKMNITLDTMGTSHSMETYAVSGVQICDLELNTTIELPKVYTKDKMPVSKEHIPTHKDVSAWSHLRDLPIPKINANVGFLIGNNVPDVYTPFDVRTGPSGSPHATKSRLGWILWNVIGSNQENTATTSHSRHTVNRAAIIAIQESEQLKQLDNLVRHSINRDFPEKVIDDKKENSVEDKQFLQKVEKSMTVDKGHYQIGLPLKEDNVRLPDNYCQALQRLRNLERRMKRNKKFQEDYKGFMSAMLDKGYAEKVEQTEIDRQDGQMWYLPHQGVYHPKKPGKIRVVFDCSAVYDGVSLNNLLLQGPDLTNSLIGVLLRFRKERIAIMGDIEAMFHQVKVPKRDQDLQRFLWWPNGDTTLQPQIYKMVVHLFGAISSPSCANAALRQTAIDNGSTFEAVIAETVMNNFYVDDCLTFVETEEKAINLIKKTSEMCSKGGFNLTKWVSNSLRVLESVPIADRAKEVKSLNLDKDSLPAERALGVSWCMETDHLGFRIVTGNCCPTRRQVLSVVSSVYDPLGLAAPFVLVARQVLQNLCRLHFDWDEELSGACLQKWNQWLSELPCLESLTLPRCYKPENFGPVASCQIHNFSDANDVGYGTASYLRLTNVEGKVHCTLLMGKSRVAPLKTVTIPRMELTAATLSVRVNHMILKELQYPANKVFYWTDSMSVLRYIANEKSRFHTFVANRVTLIREASDLNQWGYVDSKNNPADSASRGSNMAKFIEDETWLKGPTFLWKGEHEWPRCQELELALSSTDPEVKKPVVATVSDHKHAAMNRLLHYFSSWPKLKATVGWILVAIKNLQRIVQLRKDIEKEARLKENDPVRQHEFIDRELKALKVDMLSASKDGIKENLSSDVLQNAENAIIKYVQRQSFSEEMTALQADTQKGQAIIRKSSATYKMDPFVEEGFLRVGGRLKRATIPYDEKHPLLLPKSSPVSQLIVRHAHETVGHLGKNAMLTSLRRKYWIIGVNSLIKRLVSKCVVCRKYQGRLCQQKMADLPRDRVSAGDPPFSHVGVDYFGPFQIKQGRSIHKRYGVVFTCLAVRAVHLEVAHSLDADSCINAIRRFLSRRGPVKVMTSDNGSNLVGSERELREEMNKWSQVKLGKLWLRKVFAGNSTLQQALTLEVFGRESSVQ